MPSLADTVACHCCLVFFHSVIACGAFILLLSGIVHCALSRHVVMYLICACFDSSVVGVVAIPLSGATAVLVLQDGRQRNSHPIQVAFRDFRGTEMKMYRVAIVRVE